MPQQQGGSSSDGGRLDGSLQKSAAVAGNFVLGVGWGGTATITLGAGSTDQRGFVTITASATTPAQATATVTHTFADGAYAAAPFLRLESTTDQSLTEDGGWVRTTSTTGGVWTYGVLPVATKIYIVHYTYIA